jgi:hypothetical protein
VSLSKQVHLSVFIIDTFGTEVIASVKVGQAGAGLPQKWKKNKEM